MSNNNNIFNDEYRKQFLKLADYKTLNDYLKNMDRLSKKGGKYLEMYNKDLEYLLNLNDTMQDNGDIFEMMTGEKYQDAIVTEQPNTEAYINKITNITQKVNPNIPKESVAIQNLQNIKQQLLNNNNVNSANEIKKFVDMVAISQDTFNKNEYSTAFSLIKEISKIIANNSKYVKESFQYMGKGLIPHKDKISQDYIKNINDLRLNKKNLSKDKYNNEKTKLYEFYVSKLAPRGFENANLSKLVEKIIYSYKKTQ